ncbi:MAG: hypothetical protein F6K47_26270 [Symploca sp. SIO2E6]|nr:hypothetical protein [Symploca sp. SIO2E6]
MPVVVMWNWHLASSSGGTGILPVVVMWNWHLASSSYVELASVPVVVVELASCQ